MKHKFNEGDGVTWETCSVKERGEICQLLRDNGYELYSNYQDRSMDYYGTNSFQNNFRFNKQNKWVTSSTHQVTNPMNFETMKNLIEGTLSYEIY